MASRPDGRAPDQLRPVHITPSVQMHAEGSVIIETGNTRVLCAVSVEEKVPPFLRNSGKGWVTAEYGMLPRSTTTRTPREDRARGRTSEIQRLIGRSLRAVTDMEALGERTFMIDCDVLQADAGTRTAAVTGSYIALYQAFLGLQRKKLLKTIPFKSAVAAVSVGMIEGVPVLDMSYEEDSHAQVDFNVVATDKGEFVEVQGTGEARPFTCKEHDQILALALKGIQQLLLEQQNIIKSL